MESQLCAPRHLVPTTHTPSTRTQAHTPFKIVRVDVHVYLHIHIKLKLADVVIFTSPDACPPKILGRAVWMSFKTCTSTLALS
jgi:hypothetical protein